MRDIEIMRDTELMVAHIQGETDSATEFIDAYTVADLFPVDSGRIILPEPGLHAFTKAARERGFTMTGAARYRGGDGYSESWEVYCPNGCGAILDYQRFLTGRGDDGRWVNDDSVMHECVRCGFDLDDVTPDLGGRDA